MENLFGSLTKLISPEMLTSAVSALGEDKSKVSSAIPSIVSGLLGTILQKGNKNSLLETALKAAGSSNLLSNATSLFSENSDEKTQSISSDLLNSLFGDKLGAFTSLISGISGVSGPGVSKLLSMVTPLIGGFLGNKLNSGMNMSGLLGLLNSEKSSFLSAIPKGLTDVLGISSLSDLGSSLDGAGKKLNELKNDITTSSKETSMGWLKWLVPLVVLLFLGWWLLSKNSCSSPAKDLEDTTKTAIESAETSLQDGMENIQNSIDKINKEITLPSGLKLKGFEGGIEDQIFKFLTSDEYKKSTTESLKGKWFNFDAINFKFGSSELTPESEIQLKNVGAILKEFKEVKIKIGAYSDKKGDADENLKLSQERAKKVKEKLTKEGLGSQITGAEGYGSKFAKVDENASDEERAIDRKVAIRFEK